MQPFLAADRAFLLMAASDEFAQHSSGRKSVISALLNRDKPFLRLSFEVWLQVCL